MAAFVALVLGHGGRFTWDEALMVLVPLGLFAGLLALANRRAKALSEATTAEETTVDDVESAGPPSI